MGIRPLATFFVHILASRPHGAIYIGCARNLRRRVEQHCAGAAEGHTKKYRIHRLVYFEQLDTLEAALTREKRLKRWRRAWKDDLIAQVNPAWRDISDQIPL
jgi:putative endonuclease